MLTSDFGFPAWHLGASNNKLVIFIMKLRERYKRLTFWNKFAFWGSVASIMSIPTALVLLCLQPTPSFQLNWSDIEKEIGNSQNQKRYPENVATRTFWLLRDKGASISLGPCPSIKCFKIELGSLHHENNLLFQKFIITGEGLSFFSKNVEKKDGKKAFIFGIDDDFIIKNAAGTVLISLKKEVFIDIALTKGAEITIKTRSYDIKFAVIDIRADSLKIKLEIGPTSGRDNSGISVESDNRPLLRTRFPRRRVAALAWATDKGGSNLGEIDNVCK